MICFCFVFFCTNIKRRSKMSSKMSILEKKKAIFLFQYAHIWTLFYFYFHNVCLYLTLALDSVTSVLLSYIPYFSLHNIILSVPWYCQFLAKFASVPLTRTDEQVWWGRSNGWNTSSLLSFSDRIVVPQSE